MIVDFESIVFIYPSSGRELVVTYHVILVVGRLSKEVLTPYSHGRFQLHKQI